MYLICINLKTFQKKLAKPPKIWYNIVRGKQQNKHPKEKEIKKMQKRYNTIYTKEEYMKQGFKEWETVYAKRHDILFNKYVDEDISRAEMIEMFFIAKLLKL